MFLLLVVLVLSRAAAVLVLVIESAGQQWAVCTAKPTLDGKRSPTLPAEIEYEYDSSGALDEGARCNGALADARSN